MNRRQYTCIKQLDPHTKTRKQFIQILSLLKENEEFTVDDIIPKFPKSRTNNQSTIEDSITRAIRFGKSIGMIKEKQTHGMTLGQFRTIPTITALQKYLKKSKLKNSSAQMGGTFKQYSNELWHFSNWLADKSLIWSKKSKSAPALTKKRPKPSKLEVLSIFWTCTIMSRLTRKTQNLSECA